MSILASSSHTYISKHPSSSAGRSSIPYIPPLPFDTDTQLHRYPINLLHRCSALGVAYDSFERMPVPRCLPGTFTSVKADIVDWIENPGGFRIFWLNGKAGVGKTALAQTIAEHCAEMSRLGGSFFCYRGNDERSDVNQIFTTIAFQLVTSVPSSYYPISDSLAHDLTILDHHRFHDQLQKLIFNPLLHLDEPLPSPLVIIIDALDECADSALMVKMISLFATTLSTHHQTPLRLFVTSRPEPYIVDLFQNPNIEAQTRFLSLDNSNFQDNIHYYLQRGLNEIWKWKATSSEILLQDHIDSLTKLADGSFIYASTVLRFIGDDEDGSPTDRLAMILDIGQGIDCLYEKILSMAPDQYRIRSVVGTTILLLSHLPLADVGDLLKWKPADVHALRGIPSLFFIPRWSLEPVRAYHASLRDFLTDKRRAAKYFVDLKLYHGRIAQCCLQLMAQKLKRDMAGVEDPCGPAVVFRNSHSGLKEYVSGALRYACCYWALHLAQAHMTKELLADLEEFGSTNILYWVEALGIIGKLETAEQSLLSVINWLKTSTDAPQFLQQLFCEAGTLISRFADPISTCPLHVYYIALTDMQIGTILYEKYSCELDSTEDRILSKLSEVEAAITEGKQLRKFNGRKEQGHCSTLNVGGSNNANSAEGKNLVLKRIKKALTAKVCFGARK